ncbi:MAG TPA: YaiI/YqxD family protein [Thermodesulfobacteriota bacterium]|nr:YaiI/YqxD family protein [Thermodesulfobacteriota bacterium]HNU70361.1 YaiI/YqxD family protein [Thermodesulfobacteriota bacterium]HOC38113.1 YaiI/YqxD family protein [Thermodesulfobacteriota bacterium]HQO78792.1 YaiI/YqxD family protein [Thermodesulfobacteriota bacterium]
MQIYVDADGFPNAAKAILIRAALRLSIPVVFVANKLLPPEPSPLISSLLVPEGPDVADDRIVELAAAGDLVITADIPLADRVISKGAFALNPRGKLYTEENIKEYLAVRNLLSGLRDDGLMAGGPRAFGRKDCQAFADQLDRFLTRRMKEGTT